MHIIANLIKTEVKIQSFAKKKAQTKINSQSHRALV